MHRTLRTLVVIAVTSVGAALVPAAASAATVVGSLNLPPGGATSICGGSGCTVFQGQVAPASTAGYTLSSPIDGTIVSWSYRNGNASSGNVYALRLLRPVDAAQTQFTAVASSVAPPIPDDSDSLRGPFPVTIPVKAGDRIGLQSRGPTDFGVPVIQTGQNDPMTGDGVRYFAPDIADGSTATSTSPGNNGQQALVQATIDPGPPPPPELSHASLSRRLFKPVPSSGKVAAPQNRIVTRPAVTNGALYRNRKLGTTIRYTLSQDATVTFTVEKLGGCIFHRRKAHACFRYDQVGQAFEVGGAYGRQGRDQVGWLGRVSRHFPGRHTSTVVPLASGTYRLRATASNDNGQSAPALLQFRIIG